MLEFFPFIVAVFALIGVRIFRLLLEAAKKRMEAMGALARELGWRFSASKDTLHDDQYAHFEIFRRGHSRVAFNTMEGELEIDGRSYRAKAGDFQYEVTHDDVLLQLLDPASTVPQCARSPDQTRGVVRQAGGGIRLRRHRL